MSGDGLLRVGAWSPNELARIVRLFPGRGEHYLSMVLRRTPAAVRRKALELFAGPPRKGPWTAEEDMRLRLAYGVLDRKALCVVLRCSDRELRRRLSDLRTKIGTGPWNGDEKLLLKRLYGTRSNRALEVALLRPREDIVAMARELCLAKDKRFPGARGGGSMPRWTKAQIATLRRMYGNRDTLEVARALGRTVASVTNKASQLGLRKSRRLRARIGRQNVQRRSSSRSGGL